MSDDEFSTGDRVYDVETPVYEVIDVLEKSASEVIAREEQKDRGHTIYQEKTVADLNPNYPADDTVIRLKAVTSGRERLWPKSRVVSDIGVAIDKS